MDTRHKIVDAPALRGKPVTLVCAYFDPLLAWHAERLAALRARAQTLAAVVLPLENELLSQRARAELAAAMRVIDYVLIAENCVVRGLDPVEIIRLEEEDLRRRGEFIAHVRSRQIR